VNNVPVQVFLVREPSRDAARKTFDRYRAYLAQSGSDVRVTEAHGRILLEAADPLYGTVLVEQAGRHLIGAARVTDGLAAKQLIGQLRSRVGVE
jgi:hypothetical protein